MQAIGQITLNISLFIYLVYFVPQIIHNHFNQKTFEISLWTHWGMLMANGLDLVYGYGYGLPWQYLLVTWISLSFLLLQQWQIYLQSSNCSCGQHLIVHIFVITMIAMAFHPPKSALLIVGFVSVGLYSLYWLPQVLKNYRHKYVEGFSVWFIALNAIALCCDLISASVLGWPLPSILSPILILTLLMILLLQYRHYHKSI